MTATAQLRVISIGTLANHPLWGERTAARTGHATTTLITAGDARILVDPGLPAPALVARLAERAHAEPADITHVFLTSFQPDTFRAIAAFEDAEWLIHRDEREQIGVALATQLKHHASRGGAAPAGPGAELIARLEQDIAILRRCAPAPDEIAEHVTLFPLPGVTPGLCGLLVEQPRVTALVCGDAIPTVEHLEQGKVLPGIGDMDRARRSFEEAIEIADLLVLGRDNIVVNPSKNPF